LKKEGMIPIANLARFYAFANGITISSTLDRLVAAEEMGALDSETALSLREAFDVVARIRPNHHAACIEAGRVPGNVVHPKQRPALRRGRPDGRPARPGRLPPGAPGAARGRSKAAYGPRYRRRLRAGRGRARRHDRGARG